MGVLSMGYFVAFVVGVPAGALAAARLGWQWVFACLAIGSVLVLVIALAGLPQDPITHKSTRSRLAASSISRSRIVYRGSPRRFLLQAESSAF